MAMIPGVGKALKDVDLDENQFKKVEAIILSMTHAERENPELLSGSRRKRIATGSGNTIQEVNQFIKQFDEMRKMMKKMTAGGGMKRMPMTPGRR
jgi:signal recognition particle subunit SRP54